MRKHTADPSLPERLTDPVERYLAHWGHGSGIRTFENPCAPSDFSQTGVNTLNTLLPNTTMFFNGGNYPALNSAGTGAISLNPDKVLLHVLRIILKV